MSGRRVSILQPTEGVIQLHVSVKVDMAELADWKPDRIAAFFDGIAQVLASRGAQEHVQGSGRLTVDLGPR